MALKLNNSNGEYVRDPYDHKRRYKTAKDLENINKPDREIILAHLHDMELGRNVNIKVKKGSRSFIRLNTIRSRLKKLSDLINEHCHKKLTNVTEDDLLRLFKDMRDGKIKKFNGKPYTSVADYVKSFKSYWHWHMKVQKKEGKLILDITEDLDQSRDKAKFNYFTFGDLKKLGSHAKFKYKVMMWFLFDTGIRAPTELLNVKVKDLEKEKSSTNYQLNIREETSKTFGRKIKLLLCSDLVRQYIEENKLHKEDFLFNGTPSKLNEYLKRLGEKILGVKNLTMYDFRHSSACYWLSRYKSESALKWRFGWKKSDMIHYYTEFLGMKDTITQDDLIDSEAKTLIDRELEKQRKRGDILEAELSEVREALKKLVDPYKKITKQVAAVEIIFRRAKFNPEDFKAFKKQLEILRS